jgi:hypothetical protein
MKDHPPLLDNQDECDNHENFSEGRYSTPNENEYPHAPYFESPISTEHSSQHRGPPNNFRELRNEDYYDACCATNEPRPHPYNLPNIGLASERTLSRQPRTPFAAGDQGTLRRGIEKHGEVRGPNALFLEQRRRFPLSHVTPWAPQFLLHSMVDCLSCRHPIPRLTP